MGKRFNRKFNKENTGISSELMKRWTQVHYSLGEHKLKPKLDMITNQLE